LTKELGRLAKWMRICGFDAEYFTNEKPASAIVAALKEERVILTRNRRMPQGRGVTIMQIHAEDVREQLAEVYKGLGVVPSASGMFTRCTICNEELHPIDKQSVKGKVPDYVFCTQDKFFLCPRCERIYWQGTHWQSVVEALHGLLAN